MRILILGGGELAARIEKNILLVGAGQGHKVKTLQKADCDVTSYHAVAYAINVNDPDWVICTAGLSDRRIGVSIDEVVAANLIGPMNVGTAAAAYKVPCILIASTAGISPGTHKWYGPAKAGVINFARAMANCGERVWAVSPGRLDTQMREDDFPGEDRDTRLYPGIVAKVVIDVMEGQYSPGANVVVRKVGLDRIDIYEEVPTCLPSLLSD